MDNIDNIRINAQSSIRIEIKDKIVYFDPFKIEESTHDADIIFITHSHYDHFSEEDILKIENEDTKLVIPQDLQEKWKTLGLQEENILIVEPNKEYEICGIHFSTIPAYNILKPFHPRGNNWVGYIINEDTSYYIAGDTDVTKENKEVKCDIAFIPIGGTYTMNWKDATKLIENNIKPKIAIPIHYKTVVGSDEDANDFINKVKENGIDSYKLY